jgi:hypothetical protein
MPNAPRDAPDDPGEGTNHLPDREVTPAFSPQPFRPRGMRGAVASILPKRFVHWYRRQRALRRYLSQLGVELYDRQIRVDLEVLEGRLAARREGYYDRLVHDVLERVDLVLQELDRRIEGVSARHGTELRTLRAEVARLRADVEAMGPRSHPAAQLSPASGPPD